MENKVEIKTADAITAYNNAKPSGKLLLKNLLPQVPFEGKITDRVKTLVDAIAVLGISINWDNYSHCSPDEIAYMKLKIIARALNEGWKPDWNNKSEVKYYPWFYMDAASGFSFYDYAYDYSGSDVGSRLCFKSRELAEYAAKQFTVIYREFFTI